MTSEDDRNTAYLKAVKRSEEVRRDAYASADQLAADAIEDAGGKLSQSRRTSTDLATHARVTAAAGDARAGLYREAEERHFDRRAALAVHFGQRWTGPGNAGADHARQFVAEVDPDGLYAAQPPAPPVGLPAIVEHHAGVLQQRRIDERGRAVPEQFVVGGDRGTFRGDAAEFGRLKTAGTMTSKERAEAAAWVRRSLSGSVPGHSPVTAAQSVTADVSDTPAPTEAAPEPTDALSIDREGTSRSPPPGLLADIAKALGR
jgi:hypothetical protein